MSKSWGRSVQFNQLKDYEKRILLNYVTQTGLTIYQSWTTNGRVQPIEEVISTAQKLMRGGVDNYLTHK